MAAERAFGKEHVAEQIHFRRQKRRDRDDLYEKLFGALTGLG